jgi:hypothetical protein
MTAKPHEPSPPLDEGYPNQTARSIISLLVFIHVFCLFVALTTNYYLSPLQIRLVNQLAPYVQLFKIKPTAPYHLTDGSELSDDHFVEIEVTAGPQQGQVVRLPDSRVGGNLAERRVEFLARTMGATVYLGSEPNAAAMSKALGARVLAQGNNEEVVVRCRRYEPQARIYDTTVATNVADPTDESYLNTAYQARVWRDRRGEVQLLKIEETKVVAPVE